MNKSTVASADAQHPWIGLASFTEDERAFFAGRADEIDELVRLVRRENLTLLYGVSGLGKTSLLQAGVFPALREDNCLPVSIRLDHFEGAAPLASQVLEAIRAAALTAKVEAPELRAGDRLWEYFHREGNHFWSERNDLVTPFLALDQFEELFTLGRENEARAARAEEFIKQLADLVENRPPTALRDEPLRAKEFNFQPASVKLLLAMREDYLAELDRIRAHFRALGQNRLRLLPMGERQARQVIALGADLLAPGVEDRIVQYVAGAAAEARGGEITVAPALLSLVLRELNERRLARGAGAKITADLLEVEQHKIFEDFYLRTLQDFPAGVRLFIEDELLTASGHRNSCALDDAVAWPGVTLPMLNELVDRRLLAYEDRQNTRRVELTHDVLVPVIKHSRDTRLSREALAQAERFERERRAQKRKQRVTAGIAAALAVALLATLWLGYYAFVQEHQFYYRDAAKRNGFPLGVGRLTDAEARRLKISYLLVSKGITRDGWRLRWRPAFRLIAMDSRLEPTTKHTIGTYLWKNEGAGAMTSAEQSEAKAERLGLQTVCQWEYVSNAKGEIIYERALDADSRMVYGFIYSPPGSGPASTRLARFVGPDGFPQLQRRSGAEYVSIHYDAAGWEDQIMYRDGKNLPAAGPDGAFGQRRTHNGRGQITRLFSLDADGNNMIDNAGNSGLEASYNDRGWMTEVRSIGPDSKPMPVRNGFVSMKNEYDSAGRVRRTTYYGVSGEPVLVTQGFHAVEADYDEHGNATATTYLGLDGKATMLAVGVARIESVYDAEGNITRTTYYAAAGEPALHKDGNHGWIGEYDKRGNVLRTTFIGLGYQPLILAGGFATVRYAYNSRGLKTKRSYYGINDEPVLHKDGNHGLESEYDARGNEVATTFTGVDGKPIALSSVGYAKVGHKFDSDGNALEVAYFDAAGNPALGRESRVHREVNSYDGRGKVLRRQYFGPDGQPALHEDGNHGWEALYDERGNQVSQTFLDLNGKPTLVSDGYATIKSAYDARGKQTRRRVLGVNGEPVLDDDDAHGWNAEFDDRGNAIAYTYVGVDEKPTLLEEGYAMIRSAFDSRGKLIRQRYFGVEGEPVLHKDGNHGLESEYDARGNETVTTFIGLDATPTLLPVGFAIRKSVFDAFSRATRISFYGAAGEPVLRREGYHGWATEYDERGNEILRTYLALDGAPISVAEGYATVRAGYDSRGKMTRMAYYGVEGEPVLHQAGNHGWEAQYDERGNETTTTFIGLDGKPALIPQGFAIKRMSYDARGYHIRTGFHGVDGEAVAITEGYHAWEATYDELGKQLKRVYFAPDGRPISTATDSPGT